SAAHEEALGRFTTDLTARAASGDIDPVLARDVEIRQLVDVLGRRRKNNPILIGEAGVGKTAVVEGLALRIVAGDVPPSLRGVRLVTLDLGLLQAGAGMKGEFENRLKQVIREVKQSTVPTVLFIDEAHTLIGAGGSAGGSDAANLLKPALARGELRTIAATTFGEYKKYIEKDAALERRFQPIRVDEPSVEQAIVMLRGIKEKLERHHGVHILDEAVEAAVRLSERYVSGRQLPDKAVDLLDTACGRVAIAQSTKPAALDDLERRMSHLDQAIASLERDEEEALVDRKAERLALVKERKELAADHERLEAHWRKELEAVHRVRELSARAASSKAGSSKAASKDASKAASKAASKDEPPEDVPAEDVPATEAPPSEMSSKDVRTALRKALRALGDRRGEQPLVHAYVEPSVIAQIVSDWTGIPVGTMVQSELAQLLDLEDRLRERIVGQDHALAAISRKIRAAKAGLEAPSQPIGAFLLVGPSGVGKTETALALADALFGGERFVVTVNMSEFM
ncbi:MAG: AAA family ATPase, partial [Sandaracinaceae bacterium]|nr:AAA family ATPase [Sandaracinaceae bacterium]